jgi:hypothetical protein
MMPHVERINGNEGERGKFNPEVKDGKPFKKRLGGG